MEEKTFARLTEIELEQESAEKTRLKEIIRKRPAAATNTTDTTQSDDNPTGMMEVDSDKNLSHLLDVDDSGNSDDDKDQSDTDGSDTEKEATKKVTPPVFD